MRARIAITVAGVPVNMPTHTHGQGYADANFLIPELIAGMQYRKGPYFADAGDFASAGAVDVDVFNVLDVRVSDVDYFYTSRLRGEAAPVDDVHFHPVERRSVRVGVSTSSDAAMGAETAPGQPARRRRSTCHTMGVWQGCARGR